MNILLTLNKNYIKYMISLINSINDSNNEDLDIYIFSNDITLVDINKYSNVLIKKNNYHIININKEDFNNAFITKRYPVEMYYRIFASFYLPLSIDRILYLDPDIIVKGNLKPLYDMDFDNKLIIGATNIHNTLKRINQIKNGASKESLYINTGVLLLNLVEFRKIDDRREIFEFIKDNKHLLTLPDQDVINRFYGERIKLIPNLIYNLSDRAITLNNLKIINEEINLEWVEKNAIIIHYYGKNKPWRENYKGILDIYYKKYAVKE